MMIKTCTETLSSKDSYNFCLLLAMADVKLLQLLFSALDLEFDVEVASFLKANSITNYHALKELANQEFRNRCQKFYSFHLAQKKLTPGQEVVIQIIGEAIQKMTLYEFQRFVSPKVEQRKQYQLLTELNNQSLQTSFWKYTEELKSFSLCLRILIGRYGYEFLEQNLPMPSLSLLDKELRKHEYFQESELQVNFIVNQILGFMLYDKQSRFKFDFGLQE